MSPMDRADFSKISNIEFEEDDTQDDVTNRPIFTASSFLIGLFDADLVSHF